jgi:hypothetical protein
VQEVMPVKLVSPNGKEQFPGFGRTGISDGIFHCYSVSAVQDFRPTGLSYKCQRTFFHSIQYYFSKNPAIIVAAMVLSCRNGRLFDPARPFSLEIVGLKGS